jgi:outer membrane protein assembly factor BamB
MYQGTPDHNAVVGSTMSAQWDASIGDRTNAGLAVVGSTLFLDTLAGDVFAFDLNDGHVLWQRRVDGVTMSTPIVANGLVFIGTGRNSPGELNVWKRKEGDRIYAFDASTGAERWSFKTIGEDMPSPGYANGTLIFANGDSHAYALDASTGKLLWSRSLPGIATMASADVAGSDAFLSVCGDHFHNASTLRVRVTDGRILWRAPYGSCDSAPAYDGTRVFVSGIDGMLQPYGFGGRTAVVALRATDGKLLWAYHSSADGYDTIVGSAERAVAGTYHAGTYYQAIPGEDRVIAFDANSGAIRWQMRTLAPVKMSPLVVRDRVFFGDGAGLFYTVDATNGRVLQAHIHHEPFSVSPPVLAGRTLLFADGSSLIATPLIHYWGSRIAKIPPLQVPDDACLMHGCPSADSKP